MILAILEGEESTPQLGHREVAHIMRRQHTLRLQRAAVPAMVRRVGRI